MMSYPPRVIYCLSLAFWVVAGGCVTAPLSPPDHSTPEKTLLTFHEAFCKPDQPRALNQEFECFSQQFKENNGNFDYKSYYEFRKFFEEEYPLESWLFSLQDLEDNIQDRSISSDGRRALLKLTFGGESFTIAFIRETVYRLEFDGTRRVLEEFTWPLNELATDVEGELVLSLPLTPSFRKRVDALRKILVEERWKFLDFSFLSPATGPVE